jgi:uncharacterized UBP type Zn finger protein
MLKLASSHYQYYLHPSNSSSSEFQRLMEQMKCILPTQYCFESTMTMRMICRSCHYPHRMKYETYRDFPLNIPCQDEIENDIGTNTTNHQPKPSYQLNELMKKFLEPEIRELKCPNCSLTNSITQQQEVILYKELISLAPILVFQLKRFQYSRKFQELHKIDNAVSFPLILPLQSMGILDHYSSINNSINQQQPNQSQRTPRYCPVSSVCVKSNNHVYGLYEKYWKDSHHHHNHHQQQHQQQQQQQQHTISSLSGGEKHLSEGREEDVAEEIDLIQTLHSTLDQHVHRYDETDRMSVVGEEDEEGRDDDDDDNNIEEKKSNQRSYMLTAIVRHYGSTLSLGHYICDVRSHPIESSSSSSSSSAQHKWLRYNDCNVTDISQVRNRFFSFQSLFSSYVMLYTLGYCAK